MKVKRFPGLGLAIGSLNIPGGGSIVAVKVGDRIDWDLIHKGKAPASLVKALGDIAAKTGGNVRSINPPF